LYNLVEYESAGAWSGWCRCADGSVYAVGDNYDACGSLACVNGEAWGCDPAVETGQGVKVTCAVPAPQAPPPPAPPPPQYPPGLSDVVQQSAPGVGYYTGWCTCPNGNRYAVGDMRDNCGSLACIGGEGSDCSNDWYRPHKEGSGTRVFCADSYLTCEIKVLVEDTGFVGVVHDHTSWARFYVDSGELFRVRWEGNRYPTVSGTNCSQPACEVRGSACLCSLAIATAPVYTAAADAGPPSLSAAEEALRIGAPRPSMYDAGVYRRVMGGWGETELTLHVLSERAGDAPLDETAILGLPVNGTLRYFFNKASVATVAGGNLSTSFSFRNAPHFVSMLVGNATVRDAQHETTAVLEHLYTHKNTAPFLCRRLIQRLTTSNPSPRYVAACAAAFRTGAHDNVTYSGAYGDLAAASAAVLLDREARSEILDLDPTFGQLREPLLRVLHLFRSLEYTADAGAELELSVLHDCVGQQAHQAPSVFNFYKPDHKPQGVARETDVAVPEAELASSPQVRGCEEGVHPTSTAASVIELGFWALLGVGLA